MLRVLALEVWLSCAPYGLLPPFCFLLSTTPSPLVRPLRFFPSEAPCWLDSPSTLSLSLLAFTFSAGPRSRCPRPANSIGRGQGVQYTSRNSRLVYLPWTVSYLTHFDLWPHALHTWRFALWLPLSCHGTSQLWPGHSVFKHWNSTSRPHGLHRLSFLAKWRAWMPSEEATPLWFFF